MPALLDGVQLHRVDSLEKALECARWAGERRDGPLFYDTESSGLNPHRHKHRMTQLGDKRHGWAFPPEWMGAANEILERYEGELGAHNSPYDNQVLKVHQGIEPKWARTHDSLTAGSIADSVKPAGLKARSAMEVDARALAAEQRMNDGMKAQHWTWETVPFSFDPYWQYGALDPVLSAHLWDLFRPEVTGPFSRSYDLERSTLRICTNMMMKGMLTDQPYIRRSISEREAWLDGAMAWLRGVHGIDSVNSNEQVGTALNRAGIPTLVRTDGGKPSISKDTLKLYAHMFPQHEHLITTIATARKTGDVVGKYLRKFLDLAGPDGVIHYAIHPNKARTTRMSVTDPPMQTYDRDEPVVRGCYIPRPGYVFGTIDADQIEARLAAHFSQDERMIADFLYADENRLKFFIIMASKIYGRQVSKASKEYTWTKNATYAQIYGSGLERAAATAGVPIDQMAPVYYGFRQLYPKVGELMDRLIRENKGRGQRPQVRTLLGRRLYADRGHEYSLLNYMIQGTAAEILKMGLARLDAAGFGPYMCLPVHDEVVFEFPRADAEAMLAEATRVLTDRENFRVPITWQGDILEERWRKT